MSETASTIRERRNIYNQLKGYGLTASLYDRVAAVRGSKAPPSRDTVWRAFNCRHSRLSPLHLIILYVAGNILNEHISGLKEGQQHIEDKLTGSLQEGCR